MKENITGKNVLFKDLQEYIYLSLFFLLSAFFIFFVIRPNLKQVFFANKKLEQLEKINLRYSRLLEKIMAFQNDFQQYREDLVVIDQVVTNSVEINKVISDIQNVIKKGNLVIQSMSVNNIDLKNENKNKAAKAVQIDLLLNGTFPDYLNFLKELNRQRRAKVFDEVIIQKEKDGSLPQATGSANLKIQLKVSSFYL
jgi:hypothetical protein